MKQMKFSAALLCILLSCKSPWTDQDRQAVMGGCLAKAGLDMGAEKAKAYCSCMLQKLEERYPNANDARHIKNDTAMYRIGKACLQ